MGSVTSVSVIYFCPINILSLSSINRGGGGRKGGGRGVGVCKSSLCRFNVSSMLLTRWVVIKIKARR